MRNPADAITLGRVVLSSPIARGGMGQVWRGQLLQTPVAVKLVQQADAEGVAALQREIGLLAALDHPHVVWIHDRGVLRAPALELPAGTPWFAMELAAGTLADLAPRPWAETRQVLAAMLSALAHAHARGVLHLDVKPSNVLLASDGSVRLSDFGIGVHAGRAPRGVVGSPQYMAPEQFAEGGDVGRWSDLYGLGCVAWALLTGGPPFPGADWRLLRHAHSHRAPPPLMARVQVPSGIEDWLNRLLSKRPEHRFADAAEALGALAAVDAAPQPEPLSRERTRQLSLFGLRPVPLVDRQVERRALWDALAEVTRTGTPRVVVLRGRAGAGKSHLARWFVRAAAERGRAECLSAVHSALPGLADGLPGMVSTWLRCEGRSGAGRVAQVDAALSRLGHADPVTQTVLVDLLGSAAGDVGARHGALCSLLERLGRPAVLWVDDAQWGREALAFAAAVAARSVPVLVLLVVREEALADRPRTRAAVDELATTPGARTLELGALPDADHGALVHAVLPLEPGVAARVRAHTAGHPLFAVQLVADWVERELLAWTPAGFALSRTVALPESLTALVGERLARLLAGRPTEDGRALELAATLGTVVAEDEWRRVCAAAEVRLEPALIGVLVERGLAQQSPRDPGRWTWSHALLGEALREGARRAGRLTSHHVHCAEVLLAQGPEAAARAGLHLLAAGRFEEACSPLLVGLTHATRAANRPACVDLIERLETALEGAGLPEADVRWGRFWVARGLVAQASGDYAIARDWIGRAAASAGDHGWLLPELHLAQVAVHSLVGDVHGALEAAVEAGVQAGADVELGIRVQVAVGMALLHQGRLDEALVTLEEAQVRAAAEGYPWSEMRCWISVANARIQRGELEEAQRAVAAIRDAAQRAGSGRGVAECDNFLGEIRRQQGDLAAAERHYRRAWEGLRALGRAEAHTARCNLGNALLERGQQEEAQQHLQAALAWSEAQRFLPLALAARLGLLGCTATAAEEVWARQLEAVEVLLQETMYVEADLIHLAELAASLAVEPRRRAAVSELAATLQARASP